MVSPGYLTRWIPVVRFSPFFPFLPLSISRLLTLFSRDRKRTGTLPRSCSYAVRFHCGANYFTINYLGAPANYYDECAWIYSLVQKRIYPGKNSRRMTRYMNWCTCPIPLSSVLLLMRAVLQFRGASSAVIFILPVIRGEATRRYSKKYFEQRYGDGII